MTNEMNNQIYLHQQHPAWNNSCTNLFSTKLSRLQITSTKNSSGTFTSSHNLNRIYLFTQFSVAHARQPNWRSSISELIYHWGWKWRKSRRSNSNSVKQLTHSRKPTRDHILTKKNPFENVSNQPFIEHTHGHRKLAVHRLIQSHFLDQHNPLIRHQKQRSWLGRTRRRSDGPFRVTSREKTLPLHNGTPAWAKEIESL